MCGKGIEQIEVLTCVNNVQNNSTAFINNNDYTVNSQMNTNGNDTVNNHQTQSNVQNINKISSNDVINNKAEIVSVKKYLLLSLLFAIPIVGLILLIIKAFDKNTNKNISNYAKAMLIGYLIVFIIIIIITILSVVVSLSSYSSIKDAANKTMDNIYVEESMKDTNDDYDIANDNKFNGILYYSNESDINSVFDYTIPNVFENSSISTSLHYEYGDNSIFGDCVIQFNTINGYNSSQTLIKEMNDYYDGTNFNKQRINNIEWYSFEKEDSFGREVYYATDINNIVYLYQFEMNEEDLYLECSNYNNSIMNSIKLK